MKEQDAHTRQFSRFAATYDEHTIVQKKVALALVEKIENRPKTILDLGCGTGSVYHNIHWAVDDFTAVDLSPAMCETHPKALHVKVLNQSFEEASLFEKPYELIISASSLQWAKDLPTLFQNISRSGKTCALAIFTCKTFHRLHAMTGYRSRLPEVTTLQSLFETYFEGEFEVRKYQIEFPDNLSMLRYIKRSGVSGGENVVSISKLRQVIAQYPHDYLESEVFFCWGVPRSR